MAKTITTKLRASRISHKYTREQVASILAISLEDYIGYETGKKKVPDSIRDDLYNLFGGPRTYWMSDKEDVTPSVIDITRKTDE